MEVTIHWPEMDLPRDPDEQSELEQWFSNPRRRRLLYSFYVLQEAILLGLVAISTIIGMGVVSYSAPELMSNSPNLFWIAVVVAGTVILLDALASRLHTSILRYASIYIALGIILAILQIRSWMDRRRDPTIEHSSTLLRKWGENVPLIDLYFKKQKDDKFL